MEIVNDTRVQSAVVTKEGSQFVVKRGDEVLSAHKRKSDALDAWRIAMVAWEPPEIPCEYFKEHSAHEESTWDGPGRWKCKERGVVWYGPNY